MEMLPALWAKKHKIRTSTGTPFEFEKRKFMWDWLNDLSPKQVLLKPPQIGASETTFVKACYVAHKHKKDIIYTLPTQSDVHDMVGGKFNRIIAQNPILQQWVKDHDSVEQKKIGENILYLRGTFTQKAAMMVSSGLNLHDEVDASDQSVITQYETRLEAQESEADKWRWYFSHPSLMGHGVDIYWQKSDKKEWYVTCKECKAEQTLTWPDSIKEGNYICKGCARVLTDPERINGRWINQDGIPWTGEIAGDYEFSGWHVSQLMLYNKTAVDIERAFNDQQKDKQYFYNYVLGLPYIGSEDKIDPSVVLRNCVDEINDQTERVVIGVDTGHGIHFTLMNKKGVFYYGEATQITASKTPYDTIEGFLQRFPKSILISDQGGDLIGIRQLQARYPGRVFLVFYRKDRKSLDLVNWGENENYGQIVVDRNRMMTLVVEQMRDIGRYRLQGTPEDWREFASHFGNIYREKVLVKEVKDKDDRSLYGVEYVWKRNGPDHFVHSLLYATVGMQRFTNREAQVAVPGVLDGIQSGHVVDAAIIDGSVVAAYGAGGFSSENQWQG